MNRMQLKTLSRTRSAAYRLIAVLVLLTLAQPIFPQSPVVRALKKPRVRVSGRVLDPPPARPAKKVTEVGGWSTTKTTLPKISSGATIPGTGKGSISVGKGTFTLRKPSARAKTPTAMSHSPVEAQAGARTSSGFQTAQAQDVSYASRLRRQNPEKLSPAARKVHGAAIRKAEQRAGAAKAKGDKAQAYEAKQKQEKGWQRKRAQERVVNTGRRGRRSRLRELANDTKLSSADRGWLKQEIVRVKRDRRKGIRNPPGKELAHDRGREAAKGYGYEHSKMQERSLHNLQHKHDNYGRKNKERPVKRN